MNLGLKSIHLRVERKVNDRVAIRDLKMTAEVKSHRVESLIKKLKDGYDQSFSYEPNLELLWEDSFSWTKCREELGWDQRVGKDWEVNAW